LPWQSFRSKSKCEETAQENMPWQNGPLKLYHGTTQAFATEVMKGIDLSRSFSDRDFGPGFYTTRRLGQAKKFARDKYNTWKYRHSLGRTPIDPIGPSVVELSMDLDALGGSDTLAFVQPESDWSDFVTYCRYGITSHRRRRPNRFYDVVYGPVSTFRGTAFPDYEQLSFHTTNAVNVLRLVRAQRVQPPLMVKNVRPP
jgi:hypothetical protein